MRENRRNLERAHKSKARYIGRGELGDVTPVVKNMATGRLQEFCQKVETSGFSSTIGTDNGVNRSTPHLDIHTLYSHESLKFFRECPSFQNDVAIVPH